MFWLKLSGMAAWFAWLLIHITFLIGFRNRFIVVFQWAWSFVSYDRGARLITGPIRRQTGQAITGLAAQDFVDPGRIGKQRTTESNEIRAPVFDGPDGNLAAVWTQAAGGRGGRQQNRAATPCR